MVRLDVDYADEMEAVIVPADASLRLAAIVQVGRVAHSGKVLSAGADNLEVKMAAVQMDDCQAIVQGAVVKKDTGYQAVVAVQADSGEIAAVLAEILLADRGMVVAAQAGSGMVAVVQADVKAG